MESYGGFGSLPTIEEVVTTLILLCAALYSQVKSEMESLMGFKFQPSNEQIFCLLEKKRLDPHFSHHTIKDIDDICSLEPWDLAGSSKTESEDPVRYFFYKPYYKYKESTRTHRRTNAGYWKVTGRGSKIKTRTGLTGTKKILTFYRHGPASKKAKTDWVMHEFHVEDDPIYKKEFVLCRIERKWHNKHGISTTDEGESRQQMVSPVQLPPIDPRNRTKENSISNLQQLPNHNLNSYPGNHIEQNTHTFPWLIPNASVISTIQIDHLNCNRNHSEENTLTDQQLQPNHSLIDHSGNQIEENSPTNPHLPLPPNSNMESQLPLNQPMVIHDFAENNFQEEYPLPGEFNAHGSSNRRNNDSFSPMQTPIYQEQELIYSNCSFDDCGFFDCQIHSEQVNDLINSQMASQYENSHKETGRTLTSDVNSSKSAGGASAYAEDGSDTDNTAYIDAWVNELLKDIA